MLWSTIENPLPLRGIAEGATQPAPFGTHSRKIVRFNLINLIYVPGTCMTLTNLARAITILKQN